MYNYSIKVVYDTTSDSDESLDKYRKLYLKCMNIDTFDNDKINEIYDDLLPKLEACEDFNHLFKLNWNYPLIDTNWTVLLMMFSFQSFKYMHTCLQEFLTKNEISKESIIELEKSLEYLVKK